MKWFWPVFLFTAIFGTAGVYLAAPLARPLMADLFAKAPPEQPAANPYPAARPQPQPERPTPPPLPVQVRQQADEEEDSPPALLGIFPVGRSDRPGWGVTFQRTAYYKLDGTRLGTVPGGTVFDFRQAHTSSRGTMIECQFLREGRTEATFLVSRKEVHLFTSSYSRLSARQLEALKSYYERNGLIDLRKRELLQASANRNPHYQAANAAYRAFNDHIAKAKALSETRESASELEKARLEEQLRQMKLTETRLKAELTAANEKFRVWKEQHADEIAKP